MLRGAKACNVFHLGALPHCTPAGICLVESLIVKQHDI